METAIDMVLPDNLMALNGGDLAALELLDLSSAFSTFDHGVLLHQFQSPCCIDGLHPALVAGFFRTVSMIGV